MQTIKFRQRIDGLFHYWGIIDGHFITPVESSSGEYYGNTKHDQSTGLLDRTGKEIYEGDIVKDPKEHWCDANTKMHQNIGVVEWSDYNAGFMVRDLDLVVCSIGCNSNLTDEHEIIGNIYETPLEER